MILSLLGTLAFATPTSLPFSDTLGDLQTTGCDPQWDGDCEQGWGGWGGADTLEMVQYASTSHYGLKVQPGTSSWNGIWQNFAVVGGEYFHFDVNAIVLGGGTSDLTIRVIFKNSSGVNIGTQDLVVDDIVNYGMYGQYFLAPAVATSARVFVGTRDPSSGATEVVLADVSCILLAMGCGGFGGGKVESFNDQTCELECPDCNISCPEGESVVNDCSVDPTSCVYDPNNGCYCAELEEGDEKELTKLTNWF